VVETDDGAHEIALAPVPCAGNIDASVEPSSEGQNELSYDRIHTMTHSGS
jgi:hypothetical protein